MKTLKFILVDDNTSYRNALRTILSNLLEVEIIAEASNAEELYHLKNIHNADIVLMDIMMPGKSGIELTKELIWSYTKIKVIAITMHVDKVYLTTLIEAGFSGCIFKNDLVNQLKDAIETVSAGRLFFPEEIMIDYKKHMKF